MCVMYVCVFERGNGHIHLQLLRNDSCAHFPTELEHMLKAVLEIAKDLALVLLQSVVPAAEIGHMRLHHSGCQRRFGLTLVHYTRVCSRGSEKPHFNASEIALAKKGVGLAYKERSCKLVWSDLSAPASSLFGHSTGQQDANMSQG